MQKIFRILMLMLATALAACGGGGGDGGSPGANPNQPTLVTTAGTALILPVGVAREYQISGGVPPYRINNANEAIAVGRVDGNNLTIGTVNAGTANISVLDYSGASVEIAVQVGSSIPLYTTAPGSLTVGVGSNVARSFWIGGGGAPYTVEGGDSNVALVQMIGATQWKVTGIAIGDTTVKIRDAAGEEVSIALTVGSPELRISPTDLVMPVGLEAIAKISGGQPPYRVAGGIPAAITATVQGDELRIVGSLASELEISVMDAAGQTVKVKVEINTATTSIRLSPSALVVSENDTQPIQFSIFGAQGATCVFTSDPSFLQVRPTEANCMQRNTVTLETGTRGSRCVDGNQQVLLTVVDAARSTGSATITIADNGTCGTFAVLPASAEVRTGETKQLTLSGGSGSYVVASDKANVATASASGNVLIVTGGATAGTAVITIRDRADISKVISLSVTVITDNVAAITASPQTLTNLQSGASADVLLSGGSGNFDVAVSNSQIVTAVLNGRTLRITGGVTLGDATVTLRDKADLSRTLIVPVTVVAAPAPISPMTAAPSAATGSVSETLRFVLQNGEGPYAVEVSNPSIAKIKNANAQGKVTSSIVEAELLSAGQTILVVTDARGQTLNIAVTANQAQLASLRFAPSAFEVGEDHLAPITLTVFGGTPPYRALTSDLTLSNVAVNGDTFTVGLGTRGNRCINPVDSSDPPKYIPRGFFNVVLTVVDSGGAFATSTMTIRDNGSGMPGICPQDLVLSTTADPATSILVGNSRTFSIRGGRQPYSISSSNSAVVRAELSSEAGFSLTGLTTGSATVTVRDATGTNDVTINVTVTN